HGKVDKQIWYEESIRIPFLLSYPRRLAAGWKTDTLVNVVDVMPTLLGLAGLAVPKSVEGADLSRALTARREGGSDASLIAGYMPFAASGWSYPEWRGVGTKTHTYVESREGPLELFDNRAEVYQLKNLVNDPASAALRAKFASRLRELLRKTGDQFESRQTYWKRYGFEIGKQGAVKYNQ
ncbi:MAG: sulfatase/phosphatase domain-containing protein, partial [Bryobacteraceae bacterium]